MDTSKGFKLDRITSLLNGAPCGVAVFDIAAQRTVFMNDSYLRIVGYTNEEYRADVNDDFIYLLKKEDLDTYDLILEDFRNSGEVSGREYRIRRKDGDTRWIKLAITSICIEGQTCALCFFEDVTVEKENIEQLDLVSKNIGSSISVLKIKNGTEQLVYANDTFFDFIGIERAEYLSNMRAYDRSFVSEKDFQRIGLTIAESIRMGEPREMTYQFHRPGKEPRWMQRRLTAIRQDEPGTYLLASVVTDVTDQRKEQLMHEREHQRYRLVVHEMQAAVFEWNMKTGAFSASDTFEQYAINNVVKDVLPKEFFFTKEFEEVIHPDDLKEFRCFYNKVRNGEPRAEATLRLKLLNGKFRWSKVVSFYYHDKNSVPSSILGIIIDISDQKNRSFMLDTLINAIPGGISIIKMSDRMHCLYYSDGLAKMLGYTREELDRSGWDNDFLQRLVNHHDYERLVARCAKQARRGEPIVVSYRIEKKDGTTEWVQLTAYKMDEEDGDPLYYCILTYPPKEASLYQNIVEDSNTGIIIAERETKQILFMNRRMRLLFGVGITETVEDKGLTDVVRERSKLIGDEEIAALREDAFTHYTIEYHDRVFSVQAKALEYNGIDAYCTYTVDVTEASNQQKTMQALIDNVPMGLGIYKFSRGCIEQIFLNKSFYRIVKSDPDRHDIQIGTDVYKGIFKQDAGAVRAFVDRLFAGNDQDMVEFRNLCGDGSYVWVRLSARVVGRSDNDVSAYCGYEDISAEVENKQKLQRTNALLNTEYEREKHRLHLLEKDSAMVMQFNITKNRVESFTRNNKNFKPFDIGVSKEDILGNLGEKPPSERERKIIEGYSDIDETINQMEKGVTETQREYRSRQLDGCLHWIQVITHLQKDETTGDVISYSFVRDIDAQRKRELAAESLIDAETDFVVLLSAITLKGTPVCLNQKNVVIGVHKAETFSREDLFKATDYASVVEEDKQKVADFLKIENLQAELRNKPFAIITHRQNDEGELKYKKLQSYYLDDSHEDIVIVRRDITDLIMESQKQKDALEQALSRAEKESRAKGEFLSNMSHEIRTPMNAIIGLSQLAEDEIDDPQAISKSLKSIRQSSEYLLSILNDILSMSRIESGKEELNLEWVGIDKVFSPCIEMISGPMREKGIEFEYPDISQRNQYEYRVDPVKTKRMFMNILNNACKFTHEGGHVKVSIEVVNYDAETGADVITVQDDGCGMSEKFMSKIFTPFSQERNEFSGTTQGTGLGLALARQTALAMGGDITVESELGKGSTFTIRFPYRYRPKLNADESASGAQKQVAVETLRGKRVLLCEDNLMNVLVAQKLLGRVGIESDTAANGEECLRKFCAQDPGYYNAVVMDIRMPVKDGLQAAREIRALDRPDAKGIPIIAMSANAFEEDVQKSLDAGMNDHLAKPVEPQKLYESLARNISAASHD